jgi:uncharacterized protein YfbU (UPF0304 family)
MKLTNPEKLILSMLAELHEKLGIDESNAKLIKQAIYTDNTWALSWELQGVVGDEPDPTPQHVKDVANYLDMWFFLEEGHGQLDAAGKAKIEAAVGPLGKYVKFTGFDGNNEAEMISVVRMFVEHMDRFTHFKGRELNSHVPTRGRYARMYRVFEPMRSGLAGRSLSVEDIIEILQGGIGPA